MGASLKVLVTGGSGFIGKYVVKELEEMGHKVVNWDLMTNGNIFARKRVPKGTDVIIHLAAQLEILNVEPLHELDMNVASTLHMLELARKGHVKRFVFASSAAVYGEPLNNEWQTPSDEERSPIQPFWSYGASKVAAEAYVKQYERLYGIETVIIRPSIVISKGEWYGRVLTLNLLHILKNEPILIFGDGNQTRDFVDVQDVANIICQAVTQNINTPEIFNVGSGVSTSINKLADMLSNSAVELGLNKPKIKRINPKVGVLGRKPHELINMRLSMSHTKDILKINVNTYLQGIITEELKWLMGLSKEELDEWSKKPRY